MFIKVAMSKGRKGRRLTTCRPTDHRSVSLLSDFYPDANWLEGQPFDTGEFVLFVSDQPLGNEVAVKLLPIPYAEPAGTYTRFEIHDDKGNRIGTSMEHPVTQLLLLTSELDPEIIAGQMPIYLGVSPATPRVIVDGPEELGIDDDDDPDEDDPVVITDDLSDLELASKYLKFFLQHYVKFQKGSRITSTHLQTAIKASAPDGIRTDLLERKAITTAFRNYFGQSMGKHSARFSGEPEKFWQDFEVRVCRPDPLERTWL